MRTFRNAPRVVDIDVLVMEGICSQEDELTLPASADDRTRFVLVPLEELFPDGQVLGWDFLTAMKTVCREGVRRQDAFPEC